MRWMMCLIPVALLALAGVAFAGEKDGNPNTWQEPVTGMQFVRVPGDCFRMGTLVRDRSQQYDESPRHKVCVEDFFLGTFEVTQEQWEKVMGGNPARFAKGKNYPVEQVSWEDVQEFIARLQQKSKGNLFRLPTEAEWEYAARSEIRDPDDSEDAESGEEKAAGNEVRFSGSDQLADVGWCKNNSGGTTHPVGSKKANGLGLYDMSGNVWEWVQDWYDETYYSRSPKHAPTGPALGSQKVRRGGAWSSPEQDCRAANRSAGMPGTRHHNTGFRLVVMR